MECRELLFVWEEKAKAIRVHFSCWGLLPYLEWSRLVLATVTGALRWLREGWGGAFWKPEQVADSAICSWEPSLKAAWLTSTQSLKRKIPNRKGTAAAKLLCYCCFLAINERNYLCIKINSSVINKKYSTSLLTSLALKIMLFFLLMNGFMWV